MEARLMKKNKLFLQRKDENFEDWKYRIFEYKVDETYGLTNKDVKDILGLEETPDSIGRKIKATREYKEYLKRTGESSVDKLQEKELQVEIKRKQTQANNVEKNKLVREYSRKLNLADKLTEAVQRLEPLATITPKYEVVKDSKTREITVDIADAHYGRQGIIYGLNDDVITEYSVDIFKNRMAQLLAHVVDTIEMFNVDTVHVFNLGDAIDGLLRLTQLKSLEEGVIEQVLNFSSYMSNWLNELSAYAQVEYHSVLGNHAELRIEGIKSGELRDENLERLITEFIKLRLQDNAKVKVYEPKFFELVEVRGTNIALTHGQFERNLEHSISQYSMIYGKQIHVLKTGHLHHFNSKTVGMLGQQNIEFVQSPSICSVDEYAMKFKKTSKSGSLITVYNNIGTGKEWIKDVKFV